MSAIHDRFEAAVELGVRLLNDWRPLERRMRDAIPDLRAASYDGEPVDPEVWCDEHERSVVVCLKNDLLCTGTPLERRTDPTGDAGATHPYKDAGEFVAWAKRVSHGLEQMARIAGHYSPDDPRQSDEVERENERDDTCAICARSEKWVPKVAKVGGQDVCDWHYRFHKTHGRLPNVDEEATHQRGKRVTVRVREMDRLRAGLLQGKL